MGLHSIYTTARGQLLMMTQWPYVNQDFMLLKQEEKQRQTKNYVDSHVAMMVNMSKPVSSSSSPYVQIDLVTGLLILFRSVFTITLKGTLRKNVISWLDTLLIIPSTLQIKANVDSPQILGRCTSKLVNHFAPKSKREHFFATTTTTNAAPSSISFELSSNVSANMSVHNSDKFSPRSVQTIFIGYSMTQKGYKLFDPVTRHVNFIESIFPYASLKSSPHIAPFIPPEITDDGVTLPISPLDSTNISHISSPTATDDTLEVVPEILLDSSQIVNDDQMSNPPTSHRVSLRNKLQPAWMKDYVLQRWQQFAPFISLAAVRRWDIHQLDINNAFLHAELSEEVYMELPKDLGLAKYYIGLEINQTKDGLYLHRHKFIHDLLLEVGLENSKPLSLSVDVNVKLSPTDGILLDNPSVYCNLVAELRALADTACEIPWFTLLLSQTLPLHVVIHSNNQAALDIAVDPVFHPKTKHFALDCHFVREHVQSNLIQPRYLPSTSQLADIFTKGLSRLQHWHLLSSLNVRQPHSI
ncbi:hypothetical protein AgCh_008761 [Apium graveolens]